MISIKSKLSFFRKTPFFIAGIALLLVLAALLILSSMSSSNQAAPAMSPDISFEGEYKIGNGEWHQIVDGQHIPSTRGTVTLKGNFHMSTPSGEYIGLMPEATSISLYLDHIGVTINEKDNEGYVTDNENPLFGDDACGESWAAWTSATDGSEPVEIIIRNPHKFGNEKAVDSLLQSFSIWVTIDLEREILASGEIQRNAGLAFIIAALVFLGTALYSTLLHVKSSKLVWMLGLGILFAGIYFLYSAKGVYFWSNSIFLNTIMLGLSMMFYMLSVLGVITYFLKRNKPGGIVATAFMGITNGCLILLPVITDIYFYDTWIVWAIVQTAANALLAVCVVREIACTSDKYRWSFIGALLPLAAFEVDLIITVCGIYKGGLASQCAFVFIFIAALFTIFRLVPQSVNTAAKARELEAEKKLLDAELAKSRVSTMISQIRPHFIYNTLGSIEQLCHSDPHKAGALVHSFAKYLRGNFRELDNPRPIPMSKEMEHVRCYVNIENVRFPDMTFTFEMNSEDFFLPALTIQPIVENAIKHGLMKLEKGGSIRVVSYETETHHCVSVEDDGAGFDTGILLDERKHVGLRNIRGRLEAMVKGELIVESTVGVGTKVLIRIPKEVTK